MLPSETMIWQPEFTDKTLSRKPGAVHTAPLSSECKAPKSRIAINLSTYLFSIVQTNDIKTSLA
ncbi:hypothetical protein [Escherichia coli]